MKKLAAGVYSLLYKGWRAFRRWQPIYWLRTHTVHRLESGNRGGLAPCYEET